MRRFIAAAIFLVASMVIAGAQQPQQKPADPAHKPPQPAGGRGAAPAAAPAKPIVPVAASTIAANPDPYLGEYISLTAAVGQGLTKSTFSVDQDRTKTDKDILIIAPTLTGTVEPNAYVTVLGELVRFDPDDIKKKAGNYSLDLPPELVTKYKGKVAVLAKAVVVNSTGVDIAKVLPPPLTAEEEAYQKMMRQVGPANTAL